MNSSPPHGITKLYRFPFLISRTPPPMRHRHTTPQVQQHSQLSFTYLQLRNADMRSPGQGSAIKSGSPVCLHSPQQPCVRAAVSYRRPPLPFAACIDLRPKGNLLGQEAFPHLPQSPGYNNGSSTTSPHSQRHLIIIRFSSSHTRCIHNTHPLLFSPSFILSLARQSTVEKTTFTICM